MNVKFDGATPAPGTTLYYKQGVSSYGGYSQTVTIPPAVTCFLAGTFIQTLRGSRPVELLRTDDLLLPLNGGMKPVRWIGSSLADGRRDLAPIRIAAGSLGNHRDLNVSPNHRILLRLATAELNFGNYEVFVAAEFLVNGTTIQMFAQRQADYLHILLDQHDLIVSEGIASENLYTGATAIAALNPAGRVELRDVLRKHGIAPQALRHPSLTYTESSLDLDGISPCADTHPSSANKKNRKTFRRTENEFCKI